MSEADRLAAALKQEQWAHTETAKRVAELEAENAALKEALADAGSGPGFWFRGWEKAREHFQTPAEAVHWFGCSEQTPCPACIEKKGKDAE